MAHTSTHLAVSLVLQRFELDAEKPRLEVMATVGNASPQGLRVPCHIVQPDPFRVQVVGPDGQPVAPRAECHGYSMYTRIADTHLLGPGTHHEYRWNILDDYQFPSAGAYSLSMVMDLRPLAQRFCGTIHGSEFAPVVAESNRLVLALPRSLAVLSEIEREALADAEAQRRRMIGRLGRGLAWIAGWGRRR